jgi:hypothetical protein
MENLMNLPITAVIGPPPANVDLKQNRTWRDNAAVITISGIAVIAVVIRFIVRFRSQKARPVLDEWLIAVTLVCFSNLFSCNALRQLIYDLDPYACPFGCFISRWPLWNGKACLVSDNRRHGKNEEGTYHGFQNRMMNRAHELQILFAYLFVYLFELFLIKISILAFYRRIFGRNWSIWICLFLTTGWTVGSMVALLVSSDPVSYFWTSTYNPKGGHYRYNFYNYYIGNAAANVVIDVLILLIPIPVVWRLKLRVTQKIMITSVFFIGVSYVTNSKKPNSFPFSRYELTSRFLQRLHC